MWKQVPNATLRRSDARTLRQLFDWVLPVKWRRRPAVQPERNDAVMARASDADPLYRALMDQALDEMQSSMLCAMMRDQNPEQRAYHCGAANALAQYVMSIENWTARAKAVEGRRGVGASERQSVRA